MNGCAFGLHKYGRWSLPERPNIQVGYTVHFVCSSVVQHRTCERCGLVDVRELENEINPPDKKQSGQQAGE